MVQCKTMDDMVSLHTFLPDVQNAVCEVFQSAECSVEVSPELTEPPFNFAFRALGKNIHLLPSGSVAPKEFYHVSSMSEGVIVTDGLAGECLHLVLEGGDDWRTPLQQVFNKKLGTTWCFLVMELQTGVAHFHVLRAQSKPIKTYTECTVLWLTELKKENPASSSTSPPIPPPKPKLVKKVVKKSSVDKSATGTGTDSKTTTTTKTTKNGTTQKVVRKKVAASITATSTTATATIEGSETKTGNDISVTAKKTVVSRVRNSLTNGSGGVESCINGDGSGDSGISAVDSDAEKSPKNKKNCGFNEDERTASSVERTDSAIGDFVTPRTTPDPIMKTYLETAAVTNGSINGTDTISAARGTTDIDHSDMSASFTMRLNNTSNTVTSYKYETGKKMEKILEEGEKQKSEEWERRRLALGLSNGHSSLNGYTNGRDSSVRIRRSTPTRSSSAFTNSLLSSGFGSLQRIPSRDEITTRRFADENIPPVQVLQLVLKQFTYKELGELREVHPHWDELCGQALNTAYYELTKKADKLLTECQRRVHSAPDLHDVLAILTSVQVHILNPVDVLRPAMDEGVCCFPYGELLDKTFDIIAKAERMMRGEENIIINWKPVAELARRAQLHYKFNLEALMEEKLGEVIRLKALQSIQRIDSFMIDSTVNKLEKAAHMARDELEWEIEQLRNQNAQLKKDNRELRKDCMRLESRVEIIENKFKTMARLLQ